MIEDNGTQNLANRLVIAEAKLEQAEDRIKLLKSALVVANGLLDDNLYPNVKSNWERILKREEDGI